MIQHRNLFIAEENSSVEVVVCEHTLNDRDFLTNSATEVSVAENAQFNYSRIQNQSNKTSMVTNICFDQKANSKVNINTVTLHGGLTRNNIFSKLDGEGAENTISGFFYCDEQQHVDYYTQVDHIKPNCQSNQLIKGVLDGEATGAFNGKIHVYRDAQKTMAYQRNNNILLNSAARMNSKPTLEIYADDVKCSHGATVGQLDEDALFYMRSRGIGNEESRLLLMSAFAHEVINNIKIAPLRERIEDLIDKRLRGELSRCHNCAIHCC
jgi:Fe-S cluster assembly protein SufD